MRLSISRAWEETSGFIVREARLLVPIAMALLLLPGVAAGLLGPAKQGAEPSVAFLLLLFAEVLVGLIGQIAITRLALGRREAVGETIRLAAIRLPALLGSVFILFLPLAIGIVAFGGAAMTIGKGAGSQPGLALLIALGLVVLTISLLIVGVRCLLNTAIAAAEPGGPIQLLKRGFAVTRGHVLKLLGGALVLGLGGAIAIMALTSVVGLVVRLVFGDPEPWTVGALLIILTSAAAQAAFSVVFTIFLARVYAQLAEGPAGVPSSAT